MEQNQKHSNSALLVMDIQEATVKMIGDSSNLINSIKQAIKTARDNNIPVIYIVVGFRNGYPDVSSNNSSFSILKNNPAMGFDTEEGCRVYSGVAPEPGDIIITKKRVSAFTGSDLEVVLRSLEIKHLLLSGFATSGVVLSTVREAADKDYTITVLADCCGDRDEEVHRVLTTKVFPRQAEVIDVNDWFKS
jgi:nicotinamidase-related amidase